MVKQTAQMLQAFGTELAETELPNDVQSTSLVLSVHTEKKAKVKVRAACGAEQGNLIPDTRCQVSCHTEGPEVSGSLGLLIGYGELTINLSEPR